MDMLPIQFDLVMEGWCSRFGPLVEELLGWCTTFVETDTLALEYLAANLLLVACNSTCPDFMDGDLEDFVEANGYYNDAALVEFRRLMPRVAATLDGVCIFVMHLMDREIREPPNIGRPREQGLSAEGRHHRLPGLPWQAVAKRTVVSSAQGHWERDERP